MLRGERVEEAEEGRKMNQGRTWGETGGDRRSRAVGQEKRGSEIGQGMK